MPQQSVKEKVLIVTGPTASGKSALALALAEAFQGTIINADALQLYRELSILTARPSHEDEAAAPHRLYGVRSAGEPASAGWWREAALAEIRAALDAGRLPILCGGTGLYLRTLTEGISPIPPVPAEVRAAARALEERIGGPALHARLAERDPEMAERLEPGDRQRLIRAWEVLEASGRSLLAWQSERGTPAPYDFFRIVVLPPRDDLYAACDSRFETMLEAGVLEEVRALMKLRLDPELPALKALGVPELMAYLRGELHRDEAVQAAQQATRRYAKRQMTWLRSELERNKIPTEILMSKFRESDEEKIFPKIRKFLLTP